MAQFGSVSGIAENAFTVSGKKNEWSIARARSNCCCASGVHEVWKRTRPSPSVLPFVAGSSECAKAPVETATARAAADTIALVIIAVSLCPPSTLGEEPAVLPLHQPRRRTGPTGPATRRRGVA